MQTSTPVELLTLDEFIRLYEQEGPFEILDGDRKPLMPPVALHNLIIRALFRILDAFCSQQHLGEVFTEMPFVFIYDFSWVKGARIPDLMFISAARWQQYRNETQDWAQKPIILIPDLAVEVISHNDLFTDVQDIVERYLQDGVRLVWVFDPTRKRVMCYEGDHYRVLGEADMLNATPVLPHLEIPLSDIFQLVEDPEK